MTRISALQLSELDLRLTDNDRRILRTLKQLKYMKTNQVQRLFYPPLIKTPRAALTAATRNLNRLKNMGLITHLTKRIGGVRAGSQGLIWHMTEAGLRLLKLGSEDGKRSRMVEPSQTFLRHILAVAECYVQVTAVCRSEEDMTLSELTVEPECWRAYEQGGKPVSLRPDLYAEIVNGKYRDLWFIEMDLDTEAPQDVLEKCKRYHQYYQTEKEQKAKGAFPVVLWIVPGVERKERLTAAIKEQFRSRFVKIFLIITPEELHRVLKNGAGEDELC